VPLKGMGTNFDRENDPDTLQLLDESDQKWTQLWSEHMENEELNSSREVASTITCYQKR